MPKSPAASTYARIVGEVAISFNLLEQRLDSIAFMYLGLDAPTAGFVLGEMGNATKADFAIFLVDRFENDPTIKEHALYAVRLINRARENRNILEHAHPHEFRGLYEGTVYKVDKRSDYKVFDAPMPALKVLVKSMREAETYIRWIQHSITATREAKDPKLAKAMVQALSLRGKPALPDKIAPLPILEDPGALPPPPRSSWVSP